MSILSMIAGLIDLDRGGHSGHENDIPLYPVDVDTHGNSLREPHRAPALRFQRRDLSLHEREVLRCRLDRRLLLA
jgi:hypothetical protein